MADEQGPSTEWDAGWREGYRRAGGDLKVKARLHDQVSALKRENAELRAEIAALSKGSDMVVDRLQARIAKLEGACLDALALMRDRQDMIRFRSLRDEKWDRTNERLQELAAALEGCEEGGKE